MRSLTRCAITLALALVLAALSCMPGLAQDSADSAALDETGRLLWQKYFSRSATVLLFDKGEIPFAHPGRPTITAEIGGREFALLFDTGTYSSILTLDTHDLDAMRSLLRTANSAELAALESKSLTSADGSSLSFAVAPLLRTGELRIRDLPLRIYSGSSRPATDYDGAFSPLVLRDYVIEVDNDTLLIRLHQREEWQPQGRPIVLPLLNLPRGAFIPLELAGRRYWFHFDTGFSGTIGVSDSVRRELDTFATPLDAPPLIFPGWRETFDFEQLQLADVVLPSYPHLAWGAAYPYSCGAVDALAFGEQYSELAGYNVGGIVGAGFLQRFNYGIDYELGRLYLWPRD